MKFDDLDLEILNTFIENGKSSFTSTYITKKVFNVKNDTDLRKKNTQIIYRLNKLNINNLVNFKKLEKTRHYRLNYDIITIGKCHICIDDRMIDMGNAMIIELKENTLILDIDNDYVSESSVP